MNILFWGLTIGVIGKVLLATGVILAHSSIVSEKKIDTKVLRYFHIERELTLLGLVLIIVGYFMEIYFYGFTPLLTCTLEECSNAASLILSQ
jgi:hypothetical protein